MFRIIFRHGAEPQEGPVPLCKRCYQRLESKTELDINLNPRELCCDCLAAEEAQLEWETA